MKNSKKRSRRSTDKNKYPRGFERKDNHADIAHFSLQPDDIVMITTAGNEQEWLQIVLEGQRSGAQIHHFPLDYADITQMARTICREKVTVLIVSSMIWMGLYSHLKENREILNRMSILVMDTPYNPNKRYMLIPRRIPLSMKEDKAYYPQRLIPWGINVDFLDDTFLTHTKVLLN